MNKNCLKLEDLSVEEIFSLLETAKQCKNGANINKLNGKIVANLFFEPSTRTQYSFNVAEEKLGMKVITFNPESSSLTKGESFYDTVKTFESLGIDALVIRSRIDNYYNQLTNINIPILNAGDGIKNHPSQSLLDLYTIYEEFHRFEGLNIAIIGDIKHSRVAHTNIEIMKRLKMNCFISGPAFFQDDSTKYLNFDTALKEMDIIMLLRIQYERHEKKEEISQQEYYQSYGLTLDRVAKMKPNSIIMHPAPVNRNIEIADEVVECSHSRIFTQMTNGVYIRMALLLKALGE